MVAVTFAVWLKLVDGSVLFTPTADLSDKAFVMVVSDYVIALVVGLAAKLCLVLGLYNLAMSS